MEKKRKNCWVSFLLALLVLSSFAAPAAFAEVALRLGDVTAASGSTFTVDIMMTNPERVRAITGEITYNPTDLTFNSGTMVAGTWMDLTAIGGDPWFVAEPAGTINILLAAAKGAGADPATTETKIGELSFTMAASPSAESYTIAWGSEITTADNDNQALVNTTTNGTVTVAKEPKITYTVTGQGTITNAAGETLSGQVTYAADDTPTITVTPNAGYRVLTFTVDSDANAVLSNGVSGGTYNFVALKEGDNITVTATFELIPTFDVTASVNGENGTISSPGTTTYQEGEKPVYTVTPADHYQPNVFDVLGDDAAALTDNGDGTFSYTYELGKDTTITVSFTKKQYTVSVAAGANGTITPAEDTAYAAFSTPGYAIAPAENYAINTVTVDGADVIGTDNYEVGENGVATYTFPELTKDCEIAATFIRQYTVTVEAGANGAVTPADATKYNEGATPVYTITPDTANNYVVDTATVGGTSIIGTAGYVENADGSITYTFPALAADSTLAVTFKLGVFRLTVAVQPNAQAGRFRAVNPFDQEGANVIVVEAEADQQFQVLAAPSYDLPTQAQIRWVDGSQATANIANGAFTVPNVMQDAQVALVFTLKTYAITVTVDGEGVLDPVEAPAVVHGQNQTFAILPNDGYVIADVVVDGESQGSIDEYTFENVVAEGHAINVVFKLEDWDIVLNGGDYEVDWDVSFDELIRIIQLYNAKGHYCDPAGIDGFGPGGEADSDYTCKPHGCDYDCDMTDEAGNVIATTVQDWVIDFYELLRAIQLYNSQGYIQDDGTCDGFAPEAK